MLIANCLLLCSGLLAVAAVTLDPLHPLIWVAFAPWLAVLYARPLDARQGARLSLWFGIPYWLAAFCWFLALHPLTWAGIDWWLSLAGALFMWLLGSLYHAAGVALLGALLVTMRPSGWQRLLAPAALWVLLEWGLQWGILGVAIVRLPVALTDVPPLLQLLPWTGQWGVSALIMLVNAALAVAWVDRRPFRPLLVAALASGAAYGFGLWQVAAERQADAGSPPVRIAVVQGNTKVDEKWQRGKLEQVIATHLRLSRAAVRAHPDTRLVVWAETALPLYVHEWPTIYNQLQSLARPLRTSLYVGTLEHRRAIPPAEDTYYNAVLALDDTGRERGMYFKRKLVPFGEYLPGRQLLPPGLIQINVLGHDLSPGPDAALISFPFGRVGTMICFESIYAYLARQTVLDGAELLVIVTNDSWYKRTALLPLHFQQAMLRAVETRRYVIRAANTGISGLITPWGEVLDRAPIQVATELSGYVHPRTELSFYVRMGDWFVWLAAALAVWLLWRRPRGVRS